MNTDDLTKRVDELEKQLNNMQTARVTQSQIIPDAVKTRHMGEPNRYFMSGVAADRPEGHTIGQGVLYYFATDTNVLSVWNGTAYKAVTLT